MSPSPSSETTIRDSLLLFGGLQVHAASMGTAQALEWQLPPALLAYLALRPGWHSRDQLAEFLRPNAEKALARGYVRRLLHRLKQRFSFLQDLAIGDDRIAWLGGSDARDFELALQRHDWERAISLHHSFLLQGLGSCGSVQLDDWFAEERYRLAQRLSGALVGLIQERQARGRDSAEWFQKLHELDPTSENSIQFMLARARTPRERHIAASAYQALHRRLAEEMDQTPASSTVQTFLRSLATWPTPAPEPAPEPSISQGLLSPTVAKNHSTDAPGTQPSAPLGREAQLQALETLLRKPDVRLLTIYGFGGVGKTVLARALHGRLAEYGSTPAAWVELAGVGSAHGMLAQIAREIGAQLHDGLMADQLARWIGSRRLTIVLDNFEQLREHAPVLQWLLARASGLRLVLTSREMLRIPQEYAFELTGLEFKGADSPAAALFVSRVGRLGVALGAEHADAIAQLVDYLRGLPLGIELAAEWALVMPVRAILSELQANPAFIDSGQGGTRSIQSVFHAAWRRLGEEERRALIAASTIRGPVDLNAAQKISQAQPGAFLRLAAKSLLRRTQEEGFVIHPLVRDLTLHSGSSQQLQEAGERHCRHFLELLAQPPALRFGHYMPDRMSVLLAWEQDFVRAWRWAADHALWDLASAAIPNLAGFTVMGSRFEEAGDLARYALERIDPAHPLAGHLFAMQALSAFRLGRAAEAANAAASAMRYSPQGPARSALHLVFARLHRFTEAGPRHALRALDAIEPGDDDMRMWVHDELGFGYWSIDQMHEAEYWLVANLELSRQHNAVFYEARARALLGFVRYGQGRLSESIGMLEGALAVFQRMGDLYQSGICQRMLSRASGERGDVGRQMEAAQASLSALQAGGYEWELADTRIGLALACHASGQQEEALRNCRTALSQALALQQTGQALLALAVFGWLLVSQQATERGLALLAFAASHAELRKPDEPWVRGRIERLALAPELQRRAHAASERLTFASACGIVLSMP